MATLSKSAPKARATLTSTIVGDATLLKVAGVIDEHFSGFGDLTTSAVIVDLGNVTRITSFGVRQWLKAMEAVPSSTVELYLTSCPPYFVDQLNMVKGFAGRAKVVSVLAPYACASCKLESDELINVVDERDVIVGGGIPQRKCQKCKTQLGFEEMVDSYFACISAYGATDLPAPISAIVASGSSAAPTLRPVHTTDTSGAPPQKIIAPAVKNIADERDSSGSFRSALIAVLALAIVLGAFLAGRYG